MTSIEELLTYSCTKEYSRKIANHILADVLEDIKTSAGEEYNEDDIRLAIGRVLMNKLGMEE